MVVILRLKLEWEYFDLSVRRNIRNSLIKLSDEGWHILGSPSRSEDVVVGEISDTFMEPSVGNEDVALDSDSKEELLNMDYSEVNSLPSEATYFDIFLSDDDENNETQLERLPTGTSEMRLLRNRFQSIHDRAGRLKETFFNLLGALRVNSGDERFLTNWAGKNNILSSVDEKLSQAESMLLTALGGVGANIPVVSNVQSVRALNKSGRDPQYERRPCDIRVLRKKRKRSNKSARTFLHTVQTPLVDANRPSHKRINEAKRHRRNYEAAAKRSRVPKTLHSSIKPVLDLEDSDESCA